MTKTKLQPKQKRSKTSQRKANHSSPKIKARRFRPFPSSSRLNRIRGCKGGSGGPEIPGSYPKGGSSENQSQNN